LIDSVITHREAGILFPAKHQEKASDET
jgi:hypothetical protein